MAQMSQEEQQAEGQVREALRRREDNVVRPESSCVKERIGH